MRVVLRAFSDVVDLNASRVRPTGQRLLRIRGASSIPLRIRRAPSSATSKYVSPLVRKVWQKDRDDDAGNFQSRIKNPGDGAENLPSRDQQTTYSHDSEQALWRRLDADKHRKNIHIWLGLAINRRHTHGVEGIRLVWRTLLKRETELPASGEPVNELWKHFLGLGFEDPEIFKEILAYAQRQKDLLGRTWPKLYVTVLRYILLFRPNEAKFWHLRLYKEFPPSGEHFRQLVLLALHDEHRRQTCLDMHAHFPQIHIYNFAIALFCKEGLYATAVIWHEALIRRGDCPSDATKAEPVLHYLWVHNETAQLADNTRLMVEAGVSFAAYRENGVKIPSFISRDVVMPPLGTVDAIPKKKLSDDFCARLFATKVFTTDTVIASLVFLGAEEIGPQALREMTVRELDHRPCHQAIQARLDQLKKNGIAVGDSAFSIVVRRFAAQGEDDLLRSVISCDLHPDTFDNEELQESLLIYYKRQGDTVAYRRTITILLAKVPEPSVETYRLNYILRSCCSRDQKDLPGVIKSFEKMQELGILVESKSIRHMRRLLSFRQPGHRPLNTKDLGLIVRVWQYSLRSGGFIAPIYWREILRRLGMSGCLQAFEDLALWLANWYSSPAFRESQWSMCGRSHQSQGEFHHPLMSVDLKPTDPHHPFQTLFPRSLQQGIVAWGFLHTDPSLSLKQGKRDWTWGISFLRTLRSTHNVHIPTPVVEKAFKMRLLTLFGPGRSRRKTNHIGIQFSEANVDSYVEKARKIWGKDLIPRRDPVHPATDHGTGT
ncbi:MAG: hypothetical protein Q9208_007737 [Pyrenodesmia sp. 3 TL-2023]